MSTTLRDAARLTGVPASTLERWARAGMLGASKISKRKRWHRLTPDKIKALATLGLPASLGVSTAWISAIVATLEDYRRALGGSYSAVLPGDFLVCTPQRASIQHTEPPASKEWMAA